MHIAHDWNPQPQDYKGSNLTELPSSLIPKNKILH